MGSGKPMTVSETKMFIQQIVRVERMLEEARIHQPLGLGTQLIFDEWTFDKRELDKDIEAWKASSSHTHSTKIPSKKDV